ncbi:FG-GAP-like repeat-containing protein [Streptomyces sp. AK08-02]|uniref:FG-GAP-like repeat-containing protein n=1 Tax=Streptomyces sp. AK08-02 TaxID=3028654 RepID=UPI0029B6583D|nr:FG-GAP-like repeat-containing protein [Streptomyces sp. AK08-02]MDX3753392.1 FG-GAP-like repeat-containing protein [Streptomyces sp. AK08-02]
MSDLDSAAEPSEAAPEATSPQATSGRRRGHVALAVTLALTLLAGGATVLALRDDSGTEAQSEADADTKRASKLSYEDAAQQKARKTGRKTEVASLADEFSQTFANPDGTFTYKVSAQAQRAKNTKGKWAPIDTSLRKQKDGWATVNSLYPVTFATGDPDRVPGAKSRASGGSSDSTGIRTASYRTTNRTSTHTAVQAADEAETSWTPLLTMTAEGHEVQVEWPGPLPEPVIEDNKALYEGVLPDVDLMLTARDTGYTHVLVIHTPEAAAALAADPPRYRFTSPTLTFSLDPATDVMRGTDSAGDEITVSPTPFMWDSAGAHGTDTPAADPDAATGTNENPEVVEEWTGDEGSSDSGASSEDGGTDDPMAPWNNAPAAGDADPAAYAVPAAADANPTLALPSVHGPGEGAHAITAAAALNNNGVLTIAPPSGYLTGDETPVYPVFLDPSTVGIRANWTTVYKKYPNSSFYDGANYNEDTKEARVGFERDTWGTARSLFKLKFQKNITGASVTNARLEILETHSWSCAKRTMQVWHTGPFSSGTTWNKQPTWSRKITSKSFAYGWKSNSACPDTNVNFTLTSLTQEAANNGWSTLNLGLVASNSSAAPTSNATGLETDAYSWKKFQAEGDGSPELYIDYNRRPNTPTSVTMQPGSCDTSTKPYIRLGKTTPYISAKATDPDGVLTKLEFEIGRDGTDDADNYNNTKRSAFSTISNGETGSTSLSSLVNGVTYQWRVRAWDEQSSSSWGPGGGTKWCRFTYDTTLPSSPEVSSADFPEDVDINGDSEVWSKDPFGTAGAFTFKVGDPKEKDIVKFVYSINSTNTASWICANGTNGTTDGLTKSCSATSTPVTSLTVTGIKPPSAGPNLLYVKAVDAAGNISPERKYSFYVTPRTKADAAGDLSGDGAPDFASLSAAGNLLITAVSRSGTWISGFWGIHDNRDLLLDGRTAPHLWDGASTNPQYSLITHNGDFAPADGATDWVIRTPDGGLFIYPGDGYGGLDVSRRIEVRLPVNAPSPATFTEIKAAGDITGDGQPELFVAGGAGGAELWVFSGYSGGYFTIATRMTTADWGTRDFVTIADFNGDKAADMIYRIANGTLYLRKGIPDGDSGTVLTSLGTSGASLDGDDVYATGMTPTAFPLLYGGPDNTGDGIPDIWATNSAGALLLYRGGATDLGSAGTLRTSGYSTVKQLG